MGEHPVSYDDLLDYLIDKLAAERLAIVAEHLKTCERCAGTVARFSAFRSVLRNDDCIDPPPRTSARAETIFSSYRSARRAPRFNFNWRSRAFAFTGGFALAFTLLVGVGVLIANQDLAQDSVLYPVKSLVQGLQIKVTNAGQPSGVVKPPTVSVSPPANEPPIVAPKLPSNIVISQVYGGGGNTGATYTHDFIELFNRGTTAVSLEGWSVQYASATGASNFGAGATEITELPSRALAPGQYLLIQETRGTGGSLALTAPDVIDPTPIQLSATGGKVVLVKTTAPLGCNGAKTPCFPNVLAGIVDLVGYGKADFFEGLGPAPETANTTALLRLQGGCADTHNNVADFGVGYPNPHNSAFPLVPCSAGTPKP